jgi:DNA-binding MarR family transcriptional regulator
MQDMTNGIQRKRERMAERAAKAISKPAEVRRAEGSLESLIGYHLRRASLVDMTGVMAALAGANIRPVPLSVFAMIVEKPGIMAADICRQLAIQRANIVPILADLESRGLFVREADPEDHRIQRLHATKAGRAVHADWLASIRAHEEHLLRRLTTAERAILRELLEKIWREG